LSSAAQEKIMEFNNHEEAFIQSYSRLRSWAIQIARPDQELAEDLLHDAFIQFTRTQPELENIANTDAYLYGVIRNLHLSYLRKKIRREKYSRSIIDFETINLGLKNGDFLDNFQVQEELKRICYFLCLRKESSKSASVMMLRFFHGYFPSEISQVMCANTQVVKVRLNTARNEIKSVIESNEAIQTIENRISPALILKKSFRSNSDLTTALREMIFHSTDGICLDDFALREVYFEKEIIETKTLAHIVSCRKCLDKVNELLNLLPISERYSVDFIGKDGGGNPGNPTGNGGGMNEDLNEKVLQSWQRGSQEVFEHEPRKLFFSINGEVKTAQNIKQNSTEITVKTNQDEPLEFIEIFSEQNIRLAFLSFAEDSPATEKQYSFDFSEERNLSLKLKRENSQILLTAIYSDPQFEKINLLADSETEDVSFADFLETRKIINKESELFGSLLDSRKKNSFIEKIKRAFSSPFVGFKPLIAGGSLAALVIAAILFARLFIFVPNVSAIELIQKAGNIEQTDENNPEQTVYRVLSLEEKNANGEIVKKRKIECWNDAVRKLSIKRLFDENNRLIAGEWRRKDGVSTIYSVGKVSELKFAQTDKDIIVRDLENIWQLSVSAKGFESMIDAPENVSVEEVTDDYQVNYSPKLETKITKAVLFINQNLRTDKLILTVKHNDSLREFSFTETVFEQKPRETVENTVFEPNAELVKYSTAAVKNTLKPESEIEQIENPATEIAPKETSPPASVSTSSVITPETEVKVLQLLNSVNALSGDQISIIKTEEGKLQIKGIVDSKSRRDEILNALAEVRGNSAISVSIQTAEEAAKNKPSKKGKTVLESISVESKNSIPAGDLLRNNFSAQGLSEDKIESEIRRFASGALSKSSQIRRSALQMKQIAERFSVAELEKMDEATKNNWRKLIKQNAASLAQSSESLRNELRSSVGIDTGSSGENINSASDADLIKAAKKLFDLSLAIDRDIRASFSSSGAGKNNVPVKSAKFGGNLSEIIGLARQIK
jgi:RNA polymerase sigma factor (sigma-70 family)